MTKLSAEEIREEANRLAIHYAGVSQRTSLESEILSLIEKITGEKLPEPFDESKVVHGSVWKYGDSRFVLVFTANLDDVVSTLLLPWGDVSRDLWPAAKPKEVCQRLRLRNAAYLGQYNFAKGHEHIKGSAR